MSNDFLKDCDQCPGCQLTRKIMLDLDDRLILEQKRVREWKRRFFDMRKALRFNGELLVEAHSSEHKFKECVKFYADEKNWKVGQSLFPNLHDTMSITDLDGDLGAIGCHHVKDSRSCTGGKRARKCLADIGGKGE